MNIKLLPILAFLGLVAGHALGQMNLLPQGSFERPGVNTEWAEGFNIPQNQEFPLCLNMVAYFCLSLPIS